LVAAGEFTSAGGVAAKYIARWDGTAWSPLGSGMNKSVRAFTTVANGDLVAGGSFTTAGGVAAGCIARWGCPCYPDCNSDAILDIQDFGCFTNKFVLYAPYADCNADGVLETQDFACFVHKFVLGCP
jgi:hypothetical protein